MGQPHEMVDISFFSHNKACPAPVKGTVHHNDFNFQNFRGSIHFKIDSPMLCYHGFYINKLLKHEANNLE